MKVFRTVILAVLAVVVLAQVGGTATGTLAPYFKVTLLDANGDPCSSCRLFTYEAGSSTKQTTYSNVSLSSANANPIVADSAGRISAIFLPTGTSYKFVACAAGSDDPCGTPLYTQDNVANVPPSTVNVDIAGTIDASGVGVAGKVMYLCIGSGGCTSGNWGTADATNAYSSTTANAVGFLVDTVGSQGAGLIRLSGRVTGLSGLTAGTLYYVDTTGSGTLTSTAPTNVRPVGVADSTTSLIVSHWAPQPDAAATFGGRVSAGTQSFGGLKTFEGGAPLFLGSGVASNTARVSGRYTSNTSTADVGNVGSGEDTLHTTTLPAGSLGNDGMTVRYEAWGTYFDDAGNKQVKCYFGAQQLIATGTLGDGADWRVTATIIRTGAATQRAVARFALTDAAGNEVHGVDVTTPTETLSGTVVIRCTGEATNNNDVIQAVSIVEAIG